MAGRDGPPRGSGRAGRQGRTSQGPGRGREERAKTFSPFKATGTRAPSPAPGSLAGEGPQGAAQATKGVLLTGEPDPCPQLRAQFTLLAQFPRSAKSGLRELLRAGRGGEKVLPGAEWPGLWSPPSYLRNGRVRSGAWCKKEMNTTNEGAAGGGGGRETETYRAQGPSASHRGTNPRRDRVAGCQSDRKPREPESWGGGGAEADKARD